MTIRNSTSGFSDQVIKYFSDDIHPSETQGLAGLPPHPGLAVCKIWGIGTGGWGLGVYNS